MTTLAPDFAQLQAERLDQLRVMRPADYTSLIERMRQPHELPRLEYHFRRHRHEFLFDEIDRYSARFSGHIGRRDILLFTYLRERDRVPFWYVVEPVSEDVALYNELTDTYHSFFRPRDLARFVESGFGWWIEVLERGPVWEFQPWQG